MANRPNILFVFTDQQSSCAMSCAGCGDLHTPAMDSLAERGLRFELAYCTEPLCSPSRSSMFTGRMPHETGVLANNLGIDESLRDRELGWLMSRGGYECLYAGKWHLPSGSLDDGHGFEMLHPHGDAGLAEACAEYLARPHDRPFFLVVSFDNPHNICEYARMQHLPWGPIPRPASPDDCPELPANHHPPAREPQAIRIEQRCDAQKYPVVDYADDDWRRYRHAYFRLVEKVDGEIGKVLSALGEAGLEDDTIVIFSSDHGDGHGHHQWNQKSVLYEECVRVPLIVCAPGAEGRRVDDRHLVSNGLDLMPTLCDYAGIEPPDGLPGRSLRPLVDGRTPVDWRDEVLCETVFDGKRGYGTRGWVVRTNRYKYVIYNWGHDREQLFDLKKDPGETLDLAADEAHAEVLQEHRRRLTDAQATGRLMGGWESWRPGSPYEDFGSHG